jgi:hypothetical protein
MDETEVAMGALQRLARKHGNVLSLNLVFKTLLDDRICASRESITDCLHRLHTQNRIKSINFGIAIELMEKIEAESISYVQSSLGVFGNRRGI